MGKNERIEDKKRRNAPFLAAFDYLISIGIAANQGELAKLLGSNGSLISAYKSGIKGVSEDMMDRLCVVSKKKLNKNFLLGLSKYMLLENVPDDEFIELNARRENPDYDLIHKHQKKVDPTDEDFYHKRLEANADVIGMLRKDLEYFQSLVLDKDALIQEHNEQLAELAAVKKELEYTRATLDAVRKNFDQKVKELDERDRLIKTLQAELAAKGATHQFPLGVADGDNERPYLATDE